MRIFTFALLFSLALLAGCQDEAVESRTVEAVTLNEDAIGHFCQMQVLAHEGPKAQISLSGSNERLWFTQVRDGIAYFKSPEQSAEITSFYVNDMGVAPSWAKPGTDNWITAQDAFFVVGSDARGGMGAPELVPFASKSKAEKFIAERGGKVMLLSEIPAATVLSPVEMKGAPMEKMEMKGTPMKDMKMEYKKKPEKE